MLANPLKNSLHYTVSTQNTVQFTSPDWTHYLTFMAPVMGEEKDMWPSQARECPTPGFIEVKLGEKKQFPFLVVILGKCELRAKDWHNLFCKKDELTKLIKKEKPRQKMEKKDGKAQWFKEVDPPQMSL